MSDISLISGNPNKLREIQELAPKELKLKIRQLDLNEIQSLDLKEIVEDKVKRAYAVIKGPVMVEDVSAGLDDLAGLPGPFYKFFREKLGDIILYELSKIATPKVTIRCLAAYYDGKTFLLGEGVIHGTVTKPRGANGFGFDPVIIPDGQKRTMAEMSASEKNAISHRGQAFRALFAKL